MMVGQYWRPVIHSSKWQKTKLPAQWTWLEMIYCMMIYRTNQNLVTLDNPTKDSESAMKILYIDLGKGNWLEFPESGHPSIIYLPKEEIQGKPDTWSLPPHLVTWCDDHNIPINRNRTITGMVA